MTEDYSTPGYDYSYTAPDNGFAQTAPATTYNEDDISWIYGRRHLASIQNINGQQAIVAGEGHTYGQWDVYEVGADATIPGHDLDGV